MDDIFYELEAVCMIWGKDLNEFNLTAHLEIIIQDEWPTVAYVIESVEKTDFFEKFFD